MYLFADRGRSLSPLPQEGASPPLIRKTAPFHAHLIWPVLPPPAEEGYFLPLAPPERRSSPTLSRRSAFRSPVPLSRPVRKPCLHPLQEVAPFHDPPPTERAVLPLLAFPPPTRNAALTHPLRKTALTHPLRKAAPLLDKLLPLSLITHRLACLAASPKLSLQ